jgi:hypothetical protein
MLNKHIATSALFKRFDLSYLLHGFYIGTDFSFSMFMGSTIAFTWVQGYIS